MQTPTSGRRRVNAGSKKCATISSIQPSPVRSDSKGTFVADKFATVEDYCSSFPEDVRTILEDVRQAIRRAVPEAGETIRYQMPTITVDGKSLLHFAAWKHHIGLYPLPTTEGALAEELAPYDTGKGTARFPLQEPVPYDLIERLAALLVEQRARSDA